MKIWVIIAHSSQNNKKNISNCCNISFYLYEPLSSIWKYRPQIFNFPHNEHETKKLFNNIQHVWDATALALLIWDGTRPYKTTLCEKTKTKLCKSGDSSNKTTQGISCVQDWCVQLVTEGLFCVQSPLYSSIMFYHTDLNKLLPCWKPGHHWLIVWARYFIYIHTYIKYHKVS